MKNLDLTDLAVVTQILTDIDGSEERDRRTHAFDSWQVYSGWELRAFVGRCVELQGDFRA